ncbi:nucleotide-diphospho-sugar transferase [Chytridium lagenaria]|nr:nucleotide-diphospho-sugar transferase [Chytridium lagenaria]
MPLISNCWVVKNLISLTRKLHVFNPDVLEYERVAFLDADSFVVRNVDDVFGFLDGGAVFAAAPDAGWPDIFNSGVFVTTPRKDIFDGLVKESIENGSFDGGDQGLLNAFFDTWAGFPTTDSRTPNFSATRLPFSYNLTPSAVYSYLPAYVRFRSDVAIVHFAGTIKPWKLTRFTDGSVMQGDMRTETAGLHNTWWGFYDSVMGKFRAEDTVSQDVHLPPREGGVNTEGDYFSYPSPQRSPAYQPAPSAGASLPTNLRYDWDAKDFEKPRAPRSVSPVKSRTPSLPRTSPTVSPTTVAMVVTTPSPPVSTTVTPRVSTTTIKTTTTTRTTKTVHTIRMPSPTRRFQEEGELSPDGELSFVVKPGSTWSEVPGSTSTSTRVSVHETYQASSGTGTPTSTPNEYTRSRYDWDTSELTPRQRRMSETKLVVSTPVDDVQVLGAGATLYLDEDEEVFDADEVDEEGVRLRPALKVESEKMSRISSSSSISSMGKRASGVYTGAVIE